MTAVVTDLVRPNGLALSPDQTTLYVADTGETHVAGTLRAIHAYRVEDGRRAIQKGIFAICDNGFFDGFRIDIYGNVWTSSADPVRAFAPDGTLTWPFAYPNSYRMCASVVRVATDCTSRRKHRCTRST